MSIQLRGLSPSVRTHAEYTLSWADYYGIPVTITSTYRSWNEQEALYREFLAGRSRWPANPPGLSSHNWGLAFDSVVRSADQENWNWLRRALGWYVPPNDEIHAAVPNWRQYAVGKARSLQI